MPATDLKTLAEAKFGKETLSDAENLLLEKVPTGDLANCSILDDKGDNPKEADGWTQKRRIHAEVVVWLCTNELAQKQVHGRGIQVYGADLISSSDGILDLSFINISFQLEFRHCRLKGGMRLDSAEVLQLDLAGSLFINPPKKGVENSGFALSALSTEVKGSVSLDGGFVALGNVILTGAQIGGDLDCADAAFTNPPLKDIPASGTALNADRITVKGSVFLAGSFNASGEVRFYGAQISGDLTCEDGTFVNPRIKELPRSGSALLAERIYVKNSVFLTGKFSSSGEVNFIGAHIDGVFDCENGNFQAATLILSDASASILFDPQMKWPDKGRLFLDGFVYGRISTPSEERIDVTTRLDWLELQPSSPFHQQPYLHLAKVLRESGDDNGAMRVLMKMEELRRNDEDHGPFAHLESLILKGSIGYGYHPAWAMWEIVGLSAMGWIIYRRSYLAGGMVPTDKEACADFIKPERELPAQYPSFFPLIYSVENSLPLVKLGQGDKWQPDPEPDPEQNQSVPRLGNRGKWPWSWGKPGHVPLGKGETGDHYVSANLPQTEIVATQETVSVLGSTGAAAAVAPARAPEAEPSPSKRSSTIERVLIAIGLRPATDPKHVPSFLNRFGTSPRFVTWFLWFQILLGWLLATLFVAGIAGIVHKE